MDDKGEYRARWRRARSVTRAIIGGGPRETVELTALANVFVYEAHVSNDNCVLMLETDAGDFMLEAEGDCCSRSWFESFSDANKLRGEVVREIKASDYDSRKNGELKISFIEFVTTAGYARVELRNESNGYYSGYVTVTRLGDMEAEKELASTILGRGRFRELEDF